MPAAENVQRQIALAVIITVKVATPSGPVQRVVCGIEIEDDLPRPALRRLRKQIGNSTSILAPSQAVQAARSVAPSRRRDPR
jgi:hypothetical protein